MTRQHTLRERFRSLYIWHRYLGLLAALFILVLATTGILLNHTHDLGLDQRHIQAAWLLDAYGIRAPQPRSYAAGTHWISAVGQRVYFDEQEIAHDTQLHGALFNGQLIAVVLDSAIVLFTPDGVHVENIPTPAPVVDAARTNNDELLIQTSTGWWQTDGRFLTWSAPDKDNIRFALAPTVAPEHLQAALQQYYRGAALSWERVLLDLHSGRLFGKLGRYLMDAAGVLLILLALSGFVVWWQRRRQRRMQQRR